MRDHKLILQRICPKCGEKLWWSPSLRDSQLEIGVFVCRKCRHMSETVMISPPERPPRLSYEDYKRARVSSDRWDCPYCSDSFTSEPKLAKHIESLHTGTVLKEAGE